MYVCNLLRKGIIPHKLEFSANPEQQPGDNLPTELEREKGGLLDCMIVSSESILHLYPLDNLMP